MTGNQPHDAQACMPHPAKNPEAGSMSLSSQTPRAGSSVHIHLYTKQNQHRTPPPKNTQTRKRSSNSHPSIFSHALAASVRSWKLINANPFARPVSLSLAKKTLVTRPKRSKISRRSFSSANSETFVTLSVARSSRSYLPPILSPARSPAPFRRCGGT